MNRRILIVGGISYFSVTKEASAFIPLLLLAARVALTLGRVGAGVAVRSGARSIGRNVLRSSARRSVASNARQNIRIVTSKSIPYSSKVAGNTNTFNLDNAKKSLILQFIKNQIGDYITGQAASVVMADASTAKIIYLNEPNKPSPNGDFFIGEVSVHIKNESQERGYIKVRSYLFDIDDQISRNLFVENSGIAMLPGGEYNWTASLRDATYIGRKVIVTEVNDQLFNVSDVFYLQ